MTRYLVKRVLLVVLFVLLICVGGQVSALHAQFISKPNLGPAPFTVFFTDTSLGSPSDWRWDFGDGYTGEGRQIMHTYLNPGVYTVSMTVTDQIDSDTYLLPDAIQVLENPVFTSIPVISPIKPSFIADFRVNNKTGAAPLQVKFIDLSTGEPTSWNWDFGDGGSDTEQNTTHIYRTPGTYSIKLTIHKEGSTSLKEEKNYIHVLEEQASAYMGSPGTSET